MLRNSGSWNKTEQQNEEDGEILSWGERQKCWEVGQAKPPVEQGDGFRPVSISTRVLYSVYSSCMLITAVKIIKR